MRNADFLIGNSSAGIHEAPYLGVASINIGRRQENRDIETSSILHADNVEAEIKAAIEKARKMEVEAKEIKSSEKASSAFLKVLNNDTLWAIDHQKQFRDI